ncbi:MAG: hypothetical protein A4E66_00599 [Syntrophus sp. PtaB.Bin001]|nr:MAG: hypothetical protein A4E66_00599 [Syntrophus sp. PtaB.Bin001]
MFFDCSDSLSADTIKVVGCHSRFTTDHSFCHGDNVGEILAVGEDRVADMTRNGAGNLNAALTYNPGIAVLTDFYILNITGNDAADPEQYGKSAVERTVPYYRNMNDDGLESTSVQKNIAHHHLMGSADLQKILHAGYRLMDGFLIKGNSIKNPTIIVDPANDAYFFMRGKELLHQFHPSIIEVDNVFVFRELFE